MLLKRGMAWARALEDSPSLAGVAAGGNTAEVALGKAAAHIQRGR